MRRSFGPWCAHWGSECRRLDAVARLTSCLATAACSRATSAAPLPRRSVREVLLDHRASKGALRFPVVALLADDLRQRAVKVAGGIQPRHRGGEVDLRLPAH